MPVRFSWRIVLPWTILSPAANASSSGLAISRRADHGSFIPAVLTPLFAAAQVSAPSHDARRYPGEASALALIGVGVTITGIEIDDQRTQITLEVTNRADRAYLMIRMECTLYDKSGTAIATKDEFVWDLGAGNSVVRETHAPVRA